MGTSLKRIEKEFIVKSLVDGELPVELHYGQNRLRAQFVDHNDRHIHVTTEKEIEFSENAELRAYFRFHGHVMTFTFVYIKTEEDYHVFSFPTAVYRDLTRSFERIREPYDIHLIFFIKGEKYVLNYPSSQTSVPVSKPAFASNFDVTKISELLQIFREKTKAFSTDNKIVMFRERVPESYDEKLIADTGKTLLYPDSFIDSELARQYPDLELLTKESIIFYETESGTEVFDAIAKLDNIMKTKRQNNIVQELYAPILFYNYVIGYLYLLSGTEQHIRYERKIIHFVQEFARMLAYALKVNGYFKPQKVLEEYTKSNIIDISASGVLFSFPMEGQEESFVLYTDINVHLRMGEQDIPVTGRIVRRYQDGNRLYIALKYTDIDTKDMEFLARNLYGEDYIGEILLDDNGDTPDYM